MADTHLLTWRADVVGTYTTGDTSITLSDVSRLDGNVPLNINVYKTNSGTPIDAYEAGNFEVWRVTAVDTGTNVATVTRAQEGTSAITIDSDNWAVYQAVNPKSLSDKQDILAEGAFVDGDKTKLDGVESGADVTDATNVGSSINGATEKTTPVNADKIPILDSAASFVLKWFSWSTLKNFFATLSGGNTFSGVQDFDDGFTAGGLLSDLNNAVTGMVNGETRVHHYNNTATNKPVDIDNANAVITVMLSTSGSGYAKQIAFGNNDSVYQRRLFNGSWLAWAKIYDDFGNNLIIDQEIRANNGISFDGGGNVWNTFESEPFTPEIITTGTAFDSITHDVQTGIHYTLNGLHICLLDVGTSSVTIGSASGNVRVSGIPFSGEMMGKPSTMYNWAGTQRINFIRSASGEVRFYDKNISEGNVESLTSSDVRTTSTSNRILELVLIGFE